MRHTTLRGRRGLTMAIALMLLMIVAAALVAVAQLINDDAGRTLDERRGAQLRALLLAGRDYAASELAATGRVANTAIPLPAELGDAVLSLESMTDPSRCVLTVKARFDDRRLNGRFEFAASDGVWKVEHAELDVP
jgi:hypothetical protein